MCEHAAWEARFGDDGVYQTLARQKQAFSLFFHNAASLTFHTSPDETPYATKAFLFESHHPPKASTRPHPASNDIARSWFPGDIKPATDPFIQLRRPPSS